MLASQSLTMAADVPARAKIASRCCATVWPLTVSAMVKPTHLQSASESPTRAGAAPPAAPAARPTHSLMPCCGWGAQEHLGAICRKGSCAGTACTSGLPAGKDAVCGIGSFPSWLVILILRKFSSAARSFARISTQLESEKKKARKRSVAPAAADHQDTCLGRNRSKAWTTSPAGA